MRSYCGEEKMSINILIVNLHSSENAGDDVLAQVSLHQLYESFPDAKIILSMNDPASYAGTEQTVGSFMTWLKTSETYRSLLRLIIGLFDLLMSFWIALGYRFVGKQVSHWVPNRYRLLLSSYFEADIVVSSAGNFLYSSGRFGIAFLIAIYTLGYAWLIGKPLYTMPQTIGPLTHKWERILVRWVVSKMELCFVREAISVETLKQLNCWRSHCIFVPDLAFSYQSASKQDAESLLAAYGILPNGSVPLLGVTLINWEVQNVLFRNQIAYETAVNDVICHFIRQYHGKVVLFPQVTGPSPADDDRIPARRVYNRLSAFHEYVKFVDEEIIPEKLKAAYGLMDIFIGTRLHSNIFALSEYTPVIAIQYQYKTRGVMKNLGLERWVIEIETINSGKLEELLDKLWLERANLCLYLEQTMPKIVNESSSVGEKIEQDFFKKFRPDSRS